MTHITPQLRWACRRGMLELDILLGDFLKEMYATLPIEEQNIFVKLLDHSDQNLFEWLMGKKDPQNPKIKSLIEKIRYHAKNRHFT